MQISAWKDFSPLKKLWMGLVGVIGLIIIGVGLFTFRDLEFVIPSTVVSYTCQPGKSVFNTLLLNNEVVFEKSAMGALVHEIDGVKDGNGKYWLYQVDKKEATIGAQAYLCQGQEQVVWELK